MTELIRVDNLRVEFGRLAALGGVSFTMDAGDLLGLIGPNGAGKTTLLRALAGLQAPTTGTVSLLGHDLFLDGRAVRGQVGFAPDEPPAYEDLTVEQFLRFVAELHDIDGAEATERIDYWLEQVWLTEKRAVKIKNLSKGMRQRVTIAQTLVPNPVVVLLDEPSAGLDPAGRIQLRQVIASLAQQGKAVIVSSHILADLEEYCTHIAIIEHGRILRYAHVNDLGDSAADRAVYRLHTAGADDVTEALMAIPDVAGVRKLNDHYELEYDAGADAAADLLARLVHHGVRITAFAAVRANLEDVYLKTGVRQVD